MLASSEGAAAPDPKSLEGVDLFLWEDCPALTGLELRGIHRHAGPERSAQRGPSRA